MELPSLQCAIIAGPKGVLETTHAAPVPLLQPHTILVKVVATALNPVDTKMVGRLATPGATSGFDFAGTVVALGSAVSNKALQIGDRVCGAVTGQNPLNLTEGAFAEYVGVPSHAVMKIPHEMSFEDASGLGVGIGVVGLALEKSLNPARGQTVLVHGASTATGTSAVQMLKLSGQVPIGTCSPHNFGLVKSRGVDTVFDYHSSTCISEIKSHTKNSLRYVLDCISDAESMEFCYSCIGRAGGRYTALEPFPEKLQTRKTVKADWVLQPEVLGNRIGWPPPFGRQVTQETRDWAEDWFQRVQVLLEEGKLKTHPVRVMPGGLNGILRDMEMLRRKEVSGEKLVYYSR